MTSNGWSRLAVILTTAWALAFAVPATPVEPARVAEASTTETPHLQPVDGGEDYYGHFTNGLPTNPSYFPTGVWMENILDVPDLKKDRANGINTYVGITEDSIPANLEGFDAHFLATWPEEGSKGFLVSDEADMWAGPGDAAWTGRFPGHGEICEPAGSKCGYTVQRELSAAAKPDGILRYANYGKGVTFWHSDEEAGVFVNDFQDVVSADNYWFTDPNICSVHEGGRILDTPRELTPSECRRAANYGWTVDRVRSLVSPAGSKPVWAFVEVGHPFTEPDAPTIEPRQIRAAVWSSIVHGARGIVYFNHSFAGDCPSHHVLRDCGPTLSGEVSTLNAQLRELAPVLNAETVVHGADTEDGVDLLVKRDGSDLVVLAASTRQGPQDATIRVRCTNNGNAEVLWENRSVSLENGTLRDTFEDGETVHVYRISGNSCGF